MHCHSRRPRCDALPTSQALLRPATAHCRRVFAQVRDLNPNSSSLVLLRTTMTGGHFSQSSLTAQLRETAFKFAFLLQTVAPCHAGQAGKHSGEEGAAASCTACFPALVAAATTAALVSEARNAPLWLSP